MEKLESNFFYRLEKAIKTYRQFAQNQLKVNGLDITIDQWLVLKTIFDHPEISQNELADMVFKDKASITRIIDLLAKSGYLQRSVLEKNRRRTKLELTAAGREILERVMPVIADYRKAALRDVEIDAAGTADTVLQQIILNCSQK